MYIYAASRSAGRSVGRAGGQSVGLAAKSPVRGGSRHGIPHITPFLQYTYRKQLVVCPIPEGNIFSPNMALIVVLLPLDVLEYIDVSIGSSQERVVR